MVLEASNQTIGSPLNKFCFKKFQIFCHASHNKPFLYLKVGKSGHKIADVEKDAIRCPDNSCTLHVARVAHNFVGLVERWINF